MQAPSAPGGWQSEHDGPLRQQLTDQMYGGEAQLRVELRAALLNALALLVPRSYAIFDKRKNGVQSQRLPDFVTAQCISAICHAGSVFTTTSCFTFTSSCPAPGSMSMSSPGSIFTPGSIFRMVIVYGHQRASIRLARLVMT